MIDLKYSTVEEIKQKERRGINETDHPTFKS